MSEGGVSLYSQRRNFSSGYTSEGGQSTGGYLSDGGVSRYAHCMQQRFIEGMRAVRQSMDQENKLQDAERFVLKQNIFIRHFSSLFKNKFNFLINIGLELNLEHHLPKRTGILFEIE